MQITKQIFNDQVATATNLSQALLAEPEKLTPAIIHLAGREDQRFPLSFLSQGLKNGKSIKTVAYDYKVMVRFRKTRPLIATTGGGSTVGGGFAQFELVFPDRWFIKDYIIVSESGTQVRIMSEPVAKSGGYAYSCQIVDSSASAVVAINDLKAGAVWGQMFAPVGLDFSRGNRSVTQAPATVRHFLTTVRKSYQISRTGSTYVANFQFTLKGGRKSNMWMDWEEYTHMLNFMEECEMMYWYGKRNYDVNGTPTMYDENNQPIYIGPGLLNQIETKDTYSIFTEEKLKNLIGDLFYGMTDGQNRVLTIYTGTGGKREFDTAIKSYLSANEFSKFNDGVFVDGSGRSLTFGSYFTTYRHVDGHTLNIVHLPLFDNGAKAQAARKHPVTGFSIESYRMVFVDSSRYDGENNIQMVSLAGSEMKKWVVAGSIVPKGYGSESTQMRATDQDGASVHFLKSGSVVLKRYDTSIDLQCDLG